ncbi:MAG: radical SAM protein, partial [Bdellovibrionaceae bacterium]|nr:radical SAM protein [Pseudobdellovibrionaceae bacterium]
MDQELNIRIHTFGCKVNTYDSGLLQQGLKTSYPKPVHIVNTCAVTAEATREALRLVKKLKRENPQSMVVVTGCSAQVDTEKFTELCEADLVVANSHKSQLAKILEDYFDGRASSKVLKSNIFLNSDLGAGGGTEEEHTRAFLKIQDGCNSFCTYCVIPFARGRSRSIPVRQLVERIQELQRSGTKEVVITGVHIADYEDDGLYLDDLIEAILRETAIPRLRLSSLEPREITDRLLE